MSQKTCEYIVLAIVLVGSGILMYQHADGVTPDSVRDTIVLGGLLLGGYTCVAIVRHYMERKRIRQEELWDELYEQDVITFRRGLTAYLAEREASGTVADDEDPDGHEAHSPGQT